MSVLEFLLYVLLYAYVIFGFFYILQKTYRLFFTEIYTEIGISSIGIADAKNINLDIIFNDIVLKKIN